MTTVVKPLRPSSQNPCACTLKDAIEKRHRNHDRLQAPHQTYTSTQAQGTDKKRLVRWSHAQAPHPRRGSVSITAEIDTLLLSLPHWASTSSDSAYVNERQYTASRQIPHLETSGELEGDATLSGIPLQ